MSQKCLRRIQSYNQFSESVKLWSLPIVRLENCNDLLEGSKDYREYLWADLPKNQQFPDFPTSLYCQEYEEYHFGKDQDQPIDWNSILVNWIINKQINTNLRWVISLESWVRSLSLRWSILKAVSLKNWGGNSWFGYVPNFEIIGNVRILENFWCHFSSQIVPKFKNSR